MTTDTTSQLVPKLRFPEFHDTPGWQRCLIDRYLSESRIKGSGGHEAKKLTVKLWGQGVFEKQESVQGSASTQYYRRRAGQFIYSKLDFLNQAFGIIPEHLDGFQSTVDLPCFDVASELNSKFLLEYVQREQFYETRGEIADGGRKAKRFQVDMFLDCPIYVPSEPEQQKIADCLGSLNNLIAAQGQNLESLRQHKQGLMQQLFPQLGEVVPRLRFPEFRNNSTWLAPQFADLYRFRRTNTLSRNRLNYETGTIKNIHYGDIHTKFTPLFRVGDEYLPFINPNVSANGLDDDAFCEEGDIVIADASEDLNDIGKAIEVVSLDGQRVVSGMHTILATRRGSVPVVGFGGQLFQSATVRVGIKKEAQGTKVYGISANRISTLPVPIPPTQAEQKRIADCLSIFDDQIGAQIRKLDTLKQYKQGLLLQLFPSVRGIEQ